VDLKIKRLNNNAVVPEYAHATDAGFDLMATKDVIIEPGETVRVPTGLAFDVPKGYEIQIRPRSGVTSKTKLRVQLGTVDAGYHGEVDVIVDNLSDNPFGNVSRYINFVDGTELRQDKNIPDGTYLIRKGDKIAQAVLAPITYANFIEVDTFDESERGEKGFGSTGVNDDTTDYIARSYE